MSLSEIQFMIRISEKGAQKTLQGDSGAPSSLSTTKLNDLYDPPSSVSLRTLSFLSVASSNSSQLCSSNINRTWTSVSWLSHLAMSDTYSVINIKGPKEQTVYSTALLFSIYHLSGKHSVTILKNKIKTLAKNSHHNCGILAPTLKEKKKQ